MTPHLEKIRSTVTRSLQIILGEGLNDPRIRGLVSITRVEVTPDLAEARVWCSVLPSQYAPATMQGLRAAAKHLRRRLALKVHLRRTPRLDFRLDESLKRQAEILQAISSACGDEGDHEASGS